jgi:tetratricopeptide (TPR) repeat protein
MRRLKIASKPSLVIFGYPGKIRPSQAGHVTPQSTPGVGRAGHFLSYNREDQAVAKRFAEAFSAQGPDNLSAWETLMRARASQARRSLQSVLVSIAEARKANEISPDYAAAHAYLSGSLAVLYFWSGGEKAADEEAVAYIEKAIALAPGIAAVLAEASYAYAMVGRPEALTWANRAAELNPNLSTVQMALGMAYFLAGRFEEALAARATEQRLAPSGVYFFHSIFAQGWIHNYRRRPTSSSTLLRVSSITSCIAASWASSCALRKSLSTCGLSPSSISRSSARL